MLQPISDPSRRTVLSAAALLGAAALTVTSRHVPAAAAEPASTLFLTGKVTRTYRDTVQGTVDGMDYSGRADAIAVSPARNRLFAGGENGAVPGLHATDLATGTSTRSPAEAVIGPVTAMHITDDTLYLGTVGGGIHAYALAGDLEDPASYHRLVVAQTDTQGYSPLRVRTITTTDSHVVFGTQHGNTGAGTIGVIDQATGAVTIHPSPVAGTNISGLTTDGTTVYGTAKPVTLPNPGMVSGTVFAAELTNGQQLWQSPVPAEHRGLGDAVLVKGTLYLATLTSVLPLDPATGTLGTPITVRATHSTYLTNSTRLIQQAGTDRLIHRAEGAISVISTATGRATIAHDEDGEPVYYPWAITSDSAGSIWWTYGENSVREMTFDNKDSVTRPTNFYWPYEGPSTSPFVDVRTSHVFYDEIAWLADTGVSTGWSTSRGKEFRPGAQVTREIMAAFLYRLAGSPDYAAPRTSPFTDVPTTRGFYKQMAWLAEAGISTGWPAAGGPRVFRLAQNVTREQMAAFMYRLAGKPDYTAPATSPFTDVSTGHVFYREIAWLAAQGVSAGWTTSTGKVFRPAQAVTRDQMAAFMYRLAAKAL